MVAGGFQAAERRAETGCHQECREGGQLLMMWVVMFAFGRRYNMFQAYNRLGKLPGDLGIQEKHWQGQMTGDLGINNRCLLRQPTREVGKECCVRVWGLHTGCLVWRANWKSGESDRTYAGINFYIRYQIQCFQGWWAMNQEQDSTVHQKQVLTYVGSGVRP